MYRIDLRNLVRNKLYICKEYHIQPSEVDKFVYYEFEWILEEIKILQKEQEQQQEQQNKEMGSMKNGMNPSSMMNNMTSRMKMPNLGSMSMQKRNNPKKK